MLLTASSCWAAMTTVWTRFGAPPAYSTVTCDLPSGRSQGSVPSRRTRDSRCASWCASAIGSGISSSVSPHAKPIIIPWSPAPWRS